MKLAQSFQRAEEPGLKWSPYQEEVFDYVANTDGSANVIAVAGSGKTTTIVEASGRYPNPSQFLAFNRNIVGELKERLPRHVQCRTFHSLGMGTLKRRYPDTEFHQYKTSDIAGDVLREYRDRTRSYLDIRRVKPILTSLVTLAKANALGLGGEPSDQDLGFIWDFYGFDTDYQELADRLGQEVLFGLARKVFKRSIETIPHQIDYDDMVYGPVALGIAPHSTGLAFVDEAQDTNPIRLELLKMLDSRIIAVGDPQQAIYGFQGAGTDSLPSIEEQFNSIELPLTVTYRCPTEVVKVAQKYAPRLEAWEKASAGTVRTLGDYDNVHFDPEYDQAVLCRNNAPLATLYYWLWRQEIPAWINGRGEEKALLKLLDKSQRSSVQAAGEWLESHWLMQQDYLKKRERFQTLKLLEERVRMLRVFIRNTQCREVSDLKEEILGAFRKGWGVCLSTIHRAKGMQWKRVYLLDRRLIPSFWAKQEWELQQENNLMYVALTRSLDELYFIDTPPKENSDVGYSDTERLRGDLEEDQGILFRD